MDQTRQQPPRPGDKRRHINTSISERDDGGGVSINTADSPRRSSSKLSPSKFKPSPNTSAEASASPLPSQIITNVYVVLKTHIIRSGPSAAIEAPAIRTQVIAVCLRASRAREIARRVWRQSFAYGVPEDKVKEFDGLAFERMLGTADVEVCSVGNEGFVDGEDGSEVLEGERRVGVWRVGVDCGEDGKEVDGGATPESE